MIGLGSDRNDKREAFSYEVVSSLMPCGIYDFTMRHKLRVYSHRGGDRGGGEGNSHNIPECDKAEYKDHDCAYFYFRSLEVCI